LSGSGSHRRTNRLQATTDQEMRGFVGTFVATFVESAVFRQSGDFFGFLAR
jgi:hypothetical protein